MGLMDWIKGLFGGEKKEDQPQEGQPSMPEQSGSEEPKMEEGQAEESQPQEGQAEAPSESTEEERPQV